MKLTPWMAGLVGVGAIAWYLTLPKHPFDESWLAASGNIAAGKDVFLAGGCGSCHKHPDGEGMGGGLALESPFGTFFAPNISSSEAAGLGGWADHEIANAITAGTSPKRQHLYPAFPYTSYAQMTEGDLKNLIAYLRTLPPDPTLNRPHDLPFPFNVRMGLGVWKVISMNGGFVVETNSSEVEDRGRYLAEALAHCSECHTPRNAFGGLKRSAWLTGAPHPSGKGTIPDLTTLGWSEEELVFYFETGLTPDYDSAGGEMAEVIENLSQLPLSDREALAAYVLSVETARN